MLSRGLKIIYYSDRKILKKFSGQHFDRWCIWTGDNLSSAGKNERPDRLSDGQLGPDRPYQFLGRPADVSSGFRAAKLGQTVHGGPALPREQIVALGRWRAALKVLRPAGPEACEHDHRNSFVTDDSAAAIRYLYFVPRDRKILITKMRKKNNITHYRLRSVPNDMPIFQA